MWWKNGFPPRPDEGPNPELGELTAFFPWTTAIFTVMAASSTTCWEYYSEGIGKILNISGRSFSGGLVTNHNYQPGSGNRDFSAKRESELR
jgi:hypothetical protein